MSGDDDATKLPLSATSDSQGPILFHRAELSGRTVVRETFATIKADRSIIADTLFRDCVFIDCSFRTADFEAAAFENCRFSCCDFSTADFRSAQFARCEIEDCDFSGGAVKASRFQHCKLKGGQFGRQAFDQNAFIDCDFKGVSFRRATLLHLSFDNCRFVEVQFADCTSLYNFFNGCDFDTCRMNADSVALSFGLTRENLASLTLSWQGRRQRTPRNISLLLARLLEAFAARRWGVAAAALSINFSLLRTREAFRLALASIQDTIGAARRLRSDELKFLSHLITVLAERDAMPFLAVVDGLDLCGRAAEIDDYRSEESLRTLAYSLKEAELRALNAWDGTWQTLGGTDDQLLSVEFVFEVEPKATLLRLLQELDVVRGATGAPPKLIDARRGSYVEVITLTLGTLMAFLIALGMLVRIVDRLIIVRARIEVLLARSLPSTIRTRALQPLPSASAELVREVSACMAFLTGGHIPTVAAGASAIVEHLKTINVSAMSEGLPSEQ